MSSDTFVKFSYRKQLEMYYKCSTYKEYISLHKLCFFYFFDILNAKFQRCWLIKMGIKKYKQYLNRYSLLRIERKNAIWPFEDFFSFL